MSGGISAIKGFDYQAIVILSRLFDHFDGHGASALARPEGIDDLDLTGGGRHGTSPLRADQEAGGGQGWKHHPDALDARQGDRGTAAQHSRASVGK